MKSWVRKWLHYLICIFLCIVNSRNIEKNRWHLLFCAIAGFHTIVLREFTLLFWPRSPKPVHQIHFWFRGQPNLKALGYQVSDYCMSIFPQLFSLHISIFNGNGFMTDKKPSCDGNVSKGSVCKVSWRLAGTWCFGSAKFPELLENLFLLALTFKKSLSKWLSEKEA